jgi:hypothetical protein
MLTVLSHLNYLIVLAVAAIGFVLGWVWYSPLLFVRPWMKEMNFTLADMKMPRSKGLLMLAGAFALTFLSTTVLALLVTWHEQLGATGVFGGLKMGLLVGVGLVAVRHGVNSIFAMKSLKLYVIVAAHDVVLCALQGALLGLWLWPK